MRQTGSVQSSKHSVNEGSGQSLSACDWLKCLGSKVGDDVKARIHGGQRTIVERNCPGEIPSELKTIKVINVIYVSRLIISTGKQLIRKTVKESHRSNRSKCCPSVQLSRGSNRQFSGWWNEWSPCMSREWGGVRKRFVAGMRRMANSCCGGSNWSAVSRKT